MIAALLAASLLAAAPDAGAAAPGKLDRLDELAQKMDAQIEEARAQLTAMEKWARDHAGQAGKELEERIRNHKALIADLEGDLDTLRRAIARAIVEAGQPEPFNRVKGPDHAAFAEGTLTVESDGRKASCVGAHVAKRSASGDAVTWELSCDAATCRDKTARLRYDETGRIEAEVCGVAFGHAAR